MVTEIRKTKRKGKETGIWNKEAEVRPTPFPRNPLIEASIPLHGAIC